MNVVRGLRAWARGHTRARRYSPVGQIFHWGMATLVLFQLWWGWHVGRLPVGSDKFEGYQVHSQVGILLLTLVLLRMAWRLVVPGPVNDADKPGWQSRAAHLTHYLFYGLLLALPLSGWMMWSSAASEQALSLAGVAPWPQLPLQHLPERTRWTILMWAERAHFLLICALLVTTAAHVGAALKHHLIDRDDVLAAMTPFLKPLAKRDRGGSPHRAKPPPSPGRSTPG